MWRTMCAGTLFCYIGGMYVGRAMTFKQKEVISLVDGRRLRICTRRRSGL